MATSRDLTLIDALVALIDDAWEHSAPDAVSREYIAPTAEADLHKLLGRKVYLFPMAFETTDENRTENRYGYRVGAVVIERFEDADKASSAAVKAWLDERLDFVEQRLIDGLDFGQGHTLLAIGGRRIWTDTIEIPQRYDIDLLHEKKVFRCDLGFMFREID